MHHTSGSGTSQEMQACIESCTSCHNMCVQAASYSLQMGGPHAEANHVGTLLDCAQICATSADFMLRGSPFHARTCGVCAEVCEACAQACERMGDDQQMQACAQACRQCAESCQRMAAMA